MGDTSGYATQYRIIGFCLIWIIGLTFILTLVTNVQRQFGVETGESFAYPIGSANLVDTCVDKSFLIKTTTGDGAFYSSTLILAPEVDTFQSCAFIDFGKINENPKYNLSLNCNRINGCVPRVATNSEEAFLDTLNWFDWVRNLPLNFLESVGANINWNNDINFSQSIIGIPLRNNYGATSTYIDENTSEYCRGTIDFASYNINASLLDTKEKISNFCYGVDNPNVCEKFGCVWLSQNNMVKYKVQENMYRTQGNDFFNTLGGLATFSYNFGAPDFLNALINLIFFYVPLAFMVVAIVVFGRMFIGWT
jgi:hypothetical protein